MLFVCLREERYIRTPKILFLDGMAYQRQEVKTSPPGTDALVVESRNIELAAIVSWGAIPQLGTSAVRDGEIWGSKKDHGSALLEYLHDPDVKVILDELTPSSSKAERNYAVSDKRSTDSQVEEIPMKTIRVQKDGSWEVLCA